MPRSRPLTVRPRRSSGPPQHVRGAALAIALLAATGCAGGDEDGRLVLEVELGCNPLAWTGECLFPWPSRFFQEEDASAATGVRTHLHERVLEIPSTGRPVDFTAFNDSDGHPPSAPLLVHLGRDVAPEHLVGQREETRFTEEGAAIALFDYDTGERVPIVTEMDQNLRLPQHEGRHLLILRPMVPMRAGARHVAVLTTALTDAGGAPIEAPPGFAVLRDGVPTTHEALEAAREGYEALFSFLAERGYPRGELLLAWDFGVASEEWILGGILSMRAQALAVAGEPGRLGYTIDRVEDDPNPDTRRIVEGTFDVPSFLTADNALERTADGAAVMQLETQRFPFTMVIPRRAATPESLPLVLFGHGVFGNGRDYLEGTIGIETIQPLAQEAGAVVIATDFIGLSSGDRALLVEEVVNDLNQLHIITDRLQQALINNLVLVELMRDAIQDDDQVSLGPTPLLTDDVYYYGVSLGGIQGASLVSLSPRITRAVLAVPGGAWATLLTRSIVYSPIKMLIDILYPDPLLHQAFIAMLQARFDGSDGTNVGQLLLRRPLDDAPPERQVILQEAIGDCQVPNIATRILARALGVRQLVPEVETVWGLDPVTAPASGAVLAQIAMPDRLLAYTPPEENIVPEEDNGTHSDAILLPNAIDQVVSLLRDGVVEQPCDGPCDPD